MVRNNNNKLTEEGLHWSDIIDDDITELILEMREQNMSFEDISHLLFLGVADAIRDVIVNEMANSLCD